MTISTNHLYEKLQALIYRRNASPN